MGTTAQKGAYTLQTKSLLKQAINNIGGEVTDETTFRQYVNQLENAYDRLPKTEFEEGESVTLENTLKGKLDFDDGKVGFGQSSQVQTTGKNKFEPALQVGTQEITQSRCNVVIDDDEFVMNCTGQDMYFGEVTAAGSSYFAGKGVKIDVEGQTSLYLYLTNQTFFSNYITAFDSNNVSLGFRQVASYKGAYTIPEGTSYVTLRFGRANAVSGETYRTKVMVVFGSTEDTDYERYSGGYASPSPNWNEIVKCVAGKNIVESKTIGGSVTGYTDALYCKGELEPLTTYTISFEGTSGNKLYTNEKLFDLKYFEVSSGRMSLIVRTKSVISKQDSTQYKTNGWIIFKNQGNGNTNANVFDNLQIEKSIEATPYLPYNTIEEVVSGKNKLPPIFNNNITRGNLTITKNNDGTYTLNGNTGSTDEYIQGVDVESFGIKAQKLVALPTTWNSDKGYCTMRYVGNTWSNIDTGAGATLDNTKTIKFFALLLRANSSFDNVVIKPMLTDDVVDTYNDFEPYITPKTYQLSLGDKKLYDECYIVGSPDNWKIVSNWYRLTSAEFINLTIGTTGNNKQFVVVKSNFNVKPKPGKIYCTHLKYNPTTWYADGYCGIVTPGATLWMQMTQAFESVDAFKTFITTNNMEIVYQTEEPIETPITDTTLIEQLNNWYYSQSFNGTTIIESNGDLPMIIKVRGLKGAA